MKYYMVIVYMNGGRESLLVNARSKSEAFIIISTIFSDRYPVDFEKIETVIIVRDLSHEEKEIYQIS